MNLPAMIFAAVGFAAAKGAEDVYQALGSTGLPVDPPSRWLTGYF